MFITRRLITMDNVLKKSTITTQKRYTDNPDTGKDLTSITHLKTVIVYEDEQGVYPNGKVITNDITITSMDYTYNRDDDGNIISCIVKSHTDKNSKPIGRSISEEKYYDKNGRLIKSITKTVPDGVAILTKTYEYDEDGNVKTIRNKSTSNIRTTHYFLNEVESIVDETIVSHAIHTVYKASFDDNGRIYHIHDGDRNMDIEYERAFDDNGNIILEVKRFFDRCGSTKKLISYISKSFVPIADYKIGEVVENGLLKEKHTYDSNGEEIEMFTIKDNKEVFTRKESEVIETGERIDTIVKRTIDLTTGDIEETCTTKKTYSADGKILSTYTNGDARTMYEYNEDGKVSTISNERLIADEWKVINECEYTYENGKKVSTKLTEYDANGNVKSINECKKTDTENTETVEDTETLFKI